MSTFGRYVRTLHYLRPRQLWTRALRRLVKPRVAAGPHPEVRRPARSLAAPIPRTDGWSSPGTVRHLNREKTYEAAIDWRPLDAPRLWTYELNYFSDLPRSALVTGREWMADLVDAWVISNPVGTADTWDPYPISLRAVNWIKWLVLEGTGETDDRSRDRVLDSLAHQLRYLEKRLEFDIMANHLLANAVALACAGLFFDGAEGLRWARTGFTLLETELREQVLDDGGHFERSPMYHAVVLEQLLDVLNLWAVFPDAAPLSRRFRDELGSAALRMLDWLAAMVHPDGEFAFFNDTTLGVAPTYEELRAYAARIGLQHERPAFKPVHALEDSGFFRLTSDDGNTVVLFDAGDIGCDYQPGHAHSEALSFEVSRGASRVVVNSGVSTYERGAERLHERLTSAHNTLRVDGEEQSELWAAHRCGHRAHSLFAGSGHREAHGLHDGFAHLKGAPAHFREVGVSNAGVAITDEITGGGEHLVEWFFHLHPDLDAVLEDHCVVLTRGGDPAGHVVFPDDAVVSLEDGAWHPGFNLSVPNRRILAMWCGHLPGSFLISIEWT